MRVREKLCGQQTVIKHIRNEARFLTLTRHFLDKKKDLPSFSLLNSSLFSAQ